jgi:hypothetical protein
LRVGSSRQEVFALGPIKTEFVLHPRDQPVMYSSVC